MKRMKRKGMLAMLLAGVMTVLCACSSGMSAADAKSYAQAVMDASYKGEFEDYMEWTDSTEEEAEALDKAIFHDIEKIEKSEIIEK